MSDLYPEIEPYEQGFIEVGDDNSIYWETCGNPGGKPAVVLHGGPGSGCVPWHRRLFDPRAYRIVLFDQRNCGRSTPHASALDTDLKSNTTAHLIADIEQLRQRLNIDRWMVFGGSWGSTLALAYTVQCPERVTDMILFGVTTGRHKEIDWLFRGGVSIFFQSNGIVYVWIYQSQNAMVISLEPTIEGSTIPILLCASKLPMPGACGSLRHFRGHLQLDSPRDSLILLTRWRLHAS